MRSLKKKRKGRKRPSNMATKKPEKTAAKVNKASVKKPSGTTKATGKKTTGSVKKTEKTVQSTKTGQVKDNRTKGSKPAPRPPKKPVSPKPSAGRSNIAGKGPKAVSQAAKKREDVLRQQLLQNRNELLVEASNEISKYIKGETRQLVESVLDDADWSVIDLSEDINLRRLSAHQASLVKIDESLRKLKEGTYGICEDCGEAISAERLKVMLFAIYCRDCQENREEIEKVEKEEL